MQTKSEMINRIAELAKENAELKALISQRDASVTAQAGIIFELKAENEQLKEKIESYVCSQNCYAYKQADKYRQTLQEIKEIADARCNECKYGKDGISCKYGDCGEAKLHLITQLITKAEEE